MMNSAPVAHAPATHVLVSRLAVTNQGDRAWLLVLAVLTLCALLPQRAGAQNVQHTENKADLSLRSEARVDPSTLGMSISIPLAAYPGRAGHGLPVAINYSSKVWRLDYRGTDSPPITGIQTWTSAVFAEDSTAGWTSTLGVPRVEFTGMSQFYNRLGRGLCEECTSGGQPQDFTPHYVKRIHVHMPDGSSHELRVDDQVYIATSPLEPFVGTFHSVDGTRMRFESNAGGPSILHLPDGSRYVFPPYNIGNDLLATQYIDRHGNTLNYNASARQWTDTLGRVISDPLPVNPVADSETYFKAKLVGGTAEATYTLRWKRLADVLTPVNPATNEKPPLHYPGDYKCSHNSYPPVPTPHLFNSSADTRVCVERDPDNDSPIPFNPVVLAEVLLPTLNSYRFTYTVYGEIDKVYLPTGGIESFRYNQFATLSYTAPPYGQTNRGAVERKVGAGGGVAESVLTYGITSVNPYTVQATADDGTYTRRLLHRSRYSGVGDDFARFGFDDSRIGMAYEETVYSPANVMLRRMLSKWEEAGPTPGGRGGASRDPKVTKQVSILLDTGGANALSAATVNRYEQTSQPLNLTSATQYGFDDSMDKATARTAGVDSFNPPDLQAVRTTETTYIDDQTYFDRGLVALPASVIVRSGSPSTGAIVSRVGTRYDEAAFSPLPCGAMVGWGNQGTVANGNPTTSWSWLDTTNGYMETHARHDGCGNLRKSWDAKGNESQVFYDDLFSDELSHEPTFAYPTRTRTPVADADGSNASSAAFETSTKYDFQTGRIVEVTDANDQITSYSFKDDQNIPDPLNRLRRVTAPDGGWTKYEYGNTAGDLFIRTRTAIDYDGSTNVYRLTDAYQYFDGLGRPSRTYVRDGSAAGREWVATKTRYDNMGRVWEVSNHTFRADRNDFDPPASSIASSLYDDLGRVRSITTPDGASIITFYSGNEVTVTDQAGVARKSVTDVLGRLEKVIEAPGVAGYGYETRYEYDVIGNLTKVIQGGQTRAFDYDSLSRLSSAQNPEAGTVTYEYDPNGNLKKKVDARQVQTEYNYDALNRVIKRTFSVVPGQPMPPSYVAAPEVSYFYDGTGMPSGVTAPERAGVKLTAVKSAVSHTVYTEFDMAGHVRMHRQVVDPGTSVEQAYLMEYDYDLAGNMTSQKYPSGRVVPVSYDNVGRLSRVGTTGSKVYADSFKYAAHGAIEEMRLGNNLWEHTSFNSRLQPVRISLGTSSGEGSIMRLDYGYGTTNNNGNVLSQAITAPGLALSQIYAYDYVNRIILARETQTGDGSQTWQQGYTYLDSNNQNARFGNRRVDPSSTTPNVLPQHNPTINPADNRINNGQGYVYDAAGNLTLDPSHTYEYDAENRMAASDSGGDPNIATVYSYDGEGRRIKKATANGNTSIFVYSVAGQLVAEYSNQAPSGGTSYLTQDHLGSTRAVTGQNQEVKGRYDFQPFGEEVHVGRSQGGAGGSTVKQQFAGKERDNETGLDFFIARYYSPGQGRFTSVDPAFFQTSMAVDPQRVNLYAYTRNNPLKWVDPNGERVVLHGNQAWLLTNVLYEMVGGREIFDRYFEVVDGEVKLRQGVNAAPVNSGVHFLTQLVESKDVYRYHAGVSGADAAGLFDGYNNRDGTVSPLTNRQRETHSNKFEGREAGRGDRGGTLVGTSGRWSALHPQDLANGDAVFAVIAYNTNTEQTQTSIDYGEARGEEMAALAGAVGTAQAEGLGQRIRPVSLFIHESSENLIFARIRNRGQALDGDQYKPAHSQALRREYTIRRSVGITGGFAGGGVTTRVPRQ